MPHWPHAPIHLLDEPGAYMVTGGTYLKRHFLDSEAKLSLVQDALFALADEFAWEVQAWAILANHYHFVTISPDSAPTLRKLISKLHSTTATDLNKMDDAAGRRVWYEYWDRHTTYQRSYLARLNYVHHNPVHHGVVELATRYPWCSAAWFQREATPAFRKTVLSFKTDRLKVKDDF